MADDAPHNDYNGGVSIIDVQHLSKRFRVAAKQAGFFGTLKHFVRRRYRYIPAVTDVTFTIEPGEIVGFLGPNGAGKTTTLKMLTGLIHPTEGQVRVVGHDPFKRDHAFLRQITLVMGQKQQLMWDLPMMDALRINAAVYRIAPDEARKRIDELAGMLNLDSELSQPVRKLSLGQRMKGELLAALLHRPTVLFLDEPTLGLDVTAQASVRQFLREYNERYGATILITSHYMADITALCERVMMIHQGTMIFDGGLRGLTQQFATHREINVVLEEHAERADLEQFGMVESCDGHSAKIVVEREHLTEVVDRVLDAFTVTDLTITDPPIEQVIAHVFSSGQVRGADWQTRQAVVTQQGAGT